MKSVIRLLAKEVKRIRALIELMEKYNGNMHRICYRKAELDTMKRILALSIKEDLTFR